jgi:hypothetical protein
MPSIPIRPSSDTSIATASELVYVAHTDHRARHIRGRTIMVLTPGPTCVMVPSVSTMNGGSTSGVKTEGDNSQGISLLPRS